MRVHRPRGVDMFGVLTVSSPMMSSSNTVTILGVLHALGGIGLKRPKVIRTDPRQRQKRSSKKYTGQ